MSVSRSDGDNASAVCEALVVNKPYIVFCRSAGEMAFSNSKRGLEVHGRTVGRRIDATSARRNRTRVRGCKTAVARLFDDDLETAPLAT